VTGAQLRLPGSIKEALSLAKEVLIQPDHFTDSASIDEDRTSLNELFYIQNQRVILSDLGYRGQSCPICGNKAGDILFATILPEIVK
jgi:hypothetical protein